MILQGESYEFGTVFQTVAFFMFVIPRLRPGLLSLRLDVAFWQYWQSTKQQNHKTTRQQDNKKNAYRNLHI